MKKIIISNGFNKFPLANAAAEVHKHGLLAQLITGSYPTGSVQLLLSLPGLSGNPKLARLRDREAALPDGTIRALWLPEATQKLGTGMCRLGLLRQSGQRLDRWSYRAYGRLARSSVRRFAGEVNLYHYRAGFGHSSVALAKRLGIFTLCDHTAAHPGLLQYVREHEGHFPAAGAVGPMTAFWADVLADISQADAVLVNSEFVRKNFLHQGWDPSRIHLVYPGIDEEFFRYIPARLSADSAQPVRLLFAGSLEAPKGAVALMVALRNLVNIPWHLDIVGPVASDIAARFPDVLHSPKVTLAGLVRRREVAQYMARAEVFVFPSLAEGSARVVYEALACGCYVITTRHSADLQDGVHGSIIPPGDAAALEAALRSAIGNRSSLAAIGARNAELIRDNYRQRHYGEALVALYHQILEQRGQSMPAAGSSGATR